MSKIKWGILGCGRIAGKFADDLKLIEDAELWAAGSRSMEKAVTFAEKHGFRHAYGSYEALVSDPEVDVIYIASPHAQHHEHTLLCIDHGKPVLCEKAFAINGTQAREMIDRARSSGVFLMEALWSRFLPHYQETMRMIREGKLGKVGSVLANFGFIPEAPVPDRLFNPALGGGTLLDIGIYNVFFAISVLGRPDEVVAHMTPASTGIDQQCAVNLLYRNGAIAQLFSSFEANLPIEAEISGPQGRIRLTTRFYEPTARIEWYPGRVDTRTEIPISSQPGWGYHYQARHVQECLRQGLKESPMWSHADTLLLMETMDRIRQSAGISYPADQQAV
jgi:predicted dehydrogenase